MPRKGLRPRDRREAPAPDYKYNSVLVSRFVNRMNFDGKKTVGERILYEAMDILAESIAMLWNNAEMRDKFSNNIRCDYNGGDLSWKKIADTIISAYNSRYFNNRKK